MAGYVGDGFSIEDEWKEVVHYWEGPCGYWFDAGWGVRPPRLYVPAASIWDECVPGWMRHRREVIVGRLRDHSGHLIVDSAYEDPALCQARAEVRDSGGT